MAITEKQRHELIKRFEETLGPEHAETMMELLPPVGWADVATTHDLSALEARVEARFDARLSQFEARISRSFMTWMLAGMGIQTAVIGVLVSLG